MGLHYKFISSTAEYDEFPREGCVAIEFVALLTSVSYETTHYLLELQNFADGKPDPLPFLIKMRCSDKFSEKLAKMTLSLLFQCLEIDLPDSVLDDKTPLNDIHLESLCFVKCQCLYVSKESIYCVYLEKLKPFNLASVMDAASNHKNELVGKAINKTIDNLIFMDGKLTSPFTFARLTIPHEDFRHFIEKRRSSLPAQVKNPLFTANHDNYGPVESQNEFNSQFMGSGGSFDTLGFDPVEESDSSVESELTARKKPRLAMSEITPSTNMMAPVGTRINLTGQIAGLFPLGPDAAGNFRVYFIPHDWNSAPNAPLVAGVNCLECFIDRQSPIFDLMVAIFETPDAFLDILARPTISVQVQRVKWGLQDELHSSRWRLVSLEMQQELLQIVDPPKLAHKRDPLVAFKDLTIRNNEVKFVTMIGLLVACTFENSSFASMVFTDFTSNSNISQKFLFDPFLLDFSNKIEQDAGFRTLMYTNQFVQFDKRVQELYEGISLRDMFMPNSGENVSHKGILCRMSLKLKLYNGRLNAIVRNCEPISATTRLFYSDERLHLRKIRESAMKSLRQPSLNWFYDNYKVCFPLSRSDSLVTLRSFQPPFPDLKLDADDNIITCETQTQSRSRVARDIAALNCSDPSEPENSTTAVHRVEGQLLLMNIQENSAQLHVTNELITRDYVDPTRILTLELPTPSAVQAFLQGVSSNEQASTDVVGEELGFTVTRRSLPLLPIGATSCERALLVWCPIECSLAELRSQLSHSHSIKKEPN